jgi:hypothetical protein
VEHRRLVKNDEGEWHEVLIGVTAVLTPTSPRGIYQRVKRGLQRGWYAGGSGTSKPTFRQSKVHRKLRAAVVTALGGNGPAREAE